MKIGEFKDLRRAVAARSLDQIIAGAEAGSTTAATDLLAINSQDIPQQERAVAAKALYSHAKNNLAAQDLSISLKCLTLAKALQPQNQLYSTRADLLQRLIKVHEPVQWLVSLQDLQRDLKLLCHKTKCQCQSHFQIATCKGLIDPNFKFERSVAGLTIYTLGPYYSRLYLGAWTKLLKKIKKSPYDSQPLEGMADIVADFIVEKTTLLP